MNISYEEFVTSIKNALIQKYGLSQDKAEKMIEMSPLKNLFEQDAEIVSHTSCERWAKDICAFWLKNNN